MTKYKATPVFTENTVPKGLLHAHSTMAGVWGRIVVLHGQLEYVIEQPEVTSYLLTPEVFGIVQPQVLHHVKPLGAVSFQVEFYRQA